MKWPFSQKDNKPKPHISKVVTHKAEEYDTDRTLVASAGENSQVIEEHIQKYLGPVELTFHEIFSEKVHLDIEWVKPSEKYNYNILVTNGMSDLPMTVPQDKWFETFKYCELAICLPSDWKLDETSLKQEENYWPIRLLKTLARMPFDYKTFLMIDHTVANTANYLPYANNTKLSAALIGLEPTIKDMGFYKLQLKNKIINFFFVIPLYKEEADFKVKNGADALLKLFDKKGITALINPSRENAAL